MIAAPRQKVWEALNDPEILRQCIPGCQSLEKTADDKFDATVAIKIGPIGARFAGAVALSDLDPPNGYTIMGEGQGGPAGFARGGARVKLADAEGGTRLTYDVDAEVGGRMAQVGGPIIDATAKQLANAFFTKFGEVVAPPPEAAPAAAASQAAGAAPRPVSTPGAAPAAGSSQNMAPWVVSIFVAALAGFLIGGTHVFSPDAASGVLAGLVIALVGAAGFEFGRRVSAPVIKLDGAAILQLLRDAQERKS
jgi:hypothetical protein